LIIFSHKRAIKSAFRPPFCDLKLGLCNKCRCGLAHDMIHPHRSAAMPERKLVVRLVTQPIFLILFKFVVVCLLDLSKKWDIVGPLKFTFFCATLLSFGKLPFQVLTGSGAWLVLTRHYSRHHLPDADEVRWTAYPEKSLKWRELNFGEFGWIFTGSWCDSPVNDAPMRQHNSLLLKRGCWWLQRQHNMMYKAGWSSSLIVLFHSGFHRQSEGSTAPRFAFAACAWLKFPIVMLQVLAPPPRANSKCLKMERFGQCTRDIFPAM
jgi:hypothetical protein